MKEENTFSIYDELGNETKCEIINIFVLPKTNKNYMLYTDNTYTEDRLNIYAAIFDPNDETVFEEVTSDYEWEEINKIMKDLGDYSEYI